MLVLVGLLPKSKSQMCFGSPYPFVQHLFTNLFSPMSFHQHIPQWYFVYKTTTEEAENLYTRWHTCLRSEVWRVLGRMIMGIV